MMCFVFMMSYSSLLGTSSFNQRLNSFVNENNLSHQDIEHLINEINKMGDSSSNKTLAEELKKIKKKKEKEGSFPNKGGLEHHLVPLLKIIITSIISEAINVLNNV